MSATDMTAPDIQARLVEGDGLCSCGKPRRWPWLYCGHYRCDLTPEITSIRKAAYKRRRAKALQDGRDG